MLARTDGQECPPWLWLALAEMREQSHPDEALEVYLGQVEPILQRPDSGGYRQAGNILRKIQNLYARLNRKDEFQAFRTHFRTRHRNRRSLVKILDSLELPASS